MTKRPTMSKKLSLWIAGSVALVILLSLFFLNSFLEGVVKDYFDRELNRLNKSELYKLAIEDIQLSVFRGNLSLIGVSAQPTEQSLGLFEQGALEERTLKELLVSRADIKGVSLFNFLWDKDLDIRDILVEEIVFNLYRPGENIELEGIEEKKKSSFSLDSLRLPGITSVKLSQISVENYQFNIINRSMQDTLSSYKGDALVFSGLALNPAGTESPYFEIDDSKMVLDLKNQVYNLSGGLYFIAFDSFNFNTGTGRLSLKNFALKPLASRDVFSSKNRFTFEIFDVAITNFDMHGVDTANFIANGAISLDSITVHQMALQIFKDKTKPFNTAKHKLLVNERLKNLSQPLHVKRLKVSNSQLEYKELLPKGEKTLELELSDIEARIDYVTSVRDSMQTEQSLAVNLKASLMGAIPLEFELDMPYNSTNNSFSFSGITREAASFRKLNKVVSPALGIRFTGGRLNGMEFSGRGTPHAIFGDLAMYYKDLEIEIENKNDKDKKGLNWLANSVVKSSNPNKKGKLIIGSMEYKRDYNKGLGNYLWKSVQTGIINSFNPVGKRKKR